MAEAPKCEKCRRTLKDGDDVFEREYKQIDTIKDDRTVKVVKRYECAPKCP